MSPPRAFFFAAAAASACAFVANVASCTSFGEEQPGGSDATSGDDGSVALDGPAQEEAGPLDAATIVAPLCPPPRGPTSAPETRSKRILYTPPKPSFPFGIVSDATHVTWVEQTTGPDGGGGTDAYNGHAQARVLRVPKAGGEAKVLAKDQPAVMAVAVDGAFAYWTTWQGSIATLVRAPLGVSCGEGACPAPEPIAKFPAGVRVSSFFRYASEVFVMSGDNGEVFYVEGTNPPVKLVTTGFYPGLAVASTHLYASTETGSALVQRATVSATATIDPQYLTAPPEDAANLGVGHLATDCSALWMTRYFFQSDAGPGARIYVHDFATPGSLMPILDTGVNVYDLVLDAKYAYFASPARGVQVVDRVNTTARTIYGGNVFRLAVDGEGVYFGEHAGSDAGKILMLIKD